MKELKGIGTSTGKAQGKVRIIRNQDDHSKFNDGDILVTRITDPTMVMLMGKAAAIICEIGSITSHPSIVSREIGIPCVVSAKNALEHLKDGDVVDVCGESGTIRKIDNPNWRLKWQ